MTPARRTARGFTLLEVMIASALGSVLLLAALGMMGFIRNTDLRLAKRFDDVTDLTILHGAVRRAMQSMVAAPGTGNQNNSPQTQAARANESPEDRARREREETLRRSRGEEEQRRKPRFLLEPQIKGQSGADAPRRLELVLLDQPTAGPAPTAASIRGAFELRPEIDGLAIVWTPITPRGTSIKLAGGIRDVRWAAMARDEIENRFDRKSSAWRRDLAAVHLGEFPKALSLEIETNRGTTVQWLFEPAVTTGGEP